MVLYKLQRLHVDEILSLGTVFGNGAEDENFISDAAGAFVGAGEWLSICIQVAPRNFAIGTRKRQGPS
jgi:hypothetical protein